MEGKRDVPLCLQVGRVLKLKGQYCLLIHDHKEREYWIVFVFHIAYCFLAKAVTLSDEMKRLMREWRVDVKGYGIKKSWLCNCFCIYALRIGRGGHRMEEESRNAFWE